MGRAAIGWMRGLNERIAFRISGWFSTMTCFYVFCLLAFLPVLWPRSMNVVQFISSGVLQLIALPLLAVAGEIRSAKAERRAMRDHAALMELLAEKRKRKE